MESIIVYNTPFQCLNKCSFCYWKRTVDIKIVDIGAGLRSLNQKLVSDKKSTVIIAITNNPLSYEHASYVLKKTKHLRKYRETHIQLNTDGARMGDLLNILESNPVDEVTFTCSPSNHQRAIQLATVIRSSFKGKISTIVILFDEELVTVEGAVKILVNHFSSVYILPVIDEEEIKTLNRVKKYLPLLESFVKDNLKNIVIYPCMGKMRTPHCPVNTKTYVEITGNKSIHGCPYGLYRQCREPIKGDKNVN